MLDRLGSVQSCDLNLRCFYRLAQLIRSVGIPLFVIVIAALSFQLRLNAQERNSKLAILLNYNDNAIVVISISKFTEKQLELIDGMRKSGAAGKLAISESINVKDVDGKVIDGKVAFSQRRLIFTPEKNLDFGKKYTVNLELKTKPKLFETRELTVPDKKFSPTVVKKFYPRTKKIPANLSRFYIEFSGPVSNEKIEDFLNFELKLVSQPDKKQTPTISLEPVDRSRWTSLLKLDNKGTRLVFSPRENDDSILEIGKQYRFSLLGSWPDANGNPLQSKTNLNATMQTTAFDFIVVDPDTTPPDLFKWKVTLPSPNTRGPLKVRFDEQMDSAMVSECLKLYKISDGPVQGNVELVNNAMSWQFVPQREWQPGNYQIRIKNKLEDLCGNSLDDLLEARTKDKKHERNKMSEMKFALGKSKKDSEK